MSSWSIDTERDVREEGRPLVINVKIYRLERVAPLHIEARTDMIVFLEN